MTKKPMFESVREARQAGIIKRLTRALQAFVTLQDSPKCSKPECKVCRMVREGKAAIKEAREG